jgi:GT2 family glycosyltransferase
MKHLDHQKGIASGCSSTKNTKPIQPLVSICVVTWNHSECIEECIQSILSQTYQNTEIILVDNASRDETGKILSRYEHRATVVFNAENRGYCGGNNQAISLSRGEFVLLVNPDVVLKPCYLENAIRAICQGPKIGTVCGLLLLGDENEPDCRVDTTGFCITSSRRMYLRDHGVRFRDQKRQEGEVFGVDGSLPLYRREMIEDVSIDGEFFDEMFFAYKEDRDIAWRARLLGWKSYFHPGCIATHKRNFKPQSLSVRRKQSPSVKMHSIKNDIMTIIKNEDLVNGLRNIASIAGRQLATFAYVLLAERKSLRAYFWVLANLQSIMFKRKLIKAKQRIRGKKAVTNP